MIRILVTGGRDFLNQTLLYDTMDGFLSAHGTVTVLQGGARGADALAHKWCCERGIPCEVYPADWRKHGKKAGPLRNSRMLEEGKPDLLVAFPGGTGTADMTRKARASGVRTVEIVGPDQEHPT